MENKEITLVLTVEEVDKILTVLAHQPYGEVFELIEKIQAQGKPQLTEQTTDE